MVCYAQQQAAAQRERVLENQIRRFAKATQRRLRKLVKTSPRLGDLLYSFPAAAFAVVTGHGDHNRRGEAVRLVKDGASLKRVAGVLGLPLWTRRLPPEAFTVDLSGLPDEEDFNRKIVNLIPKDPEATAMWLTWLKAGREGCDEDFALWLAGQRIYGAGWRVQLADTPVPPLATFAWFSRHEDEPAWRLMVEPWHQKMGLGAAINNMVSWFDRILLDLTCADRKRGYGRYSKRKGANRYDLVPLITARELFEEGEAMNHCVATYALAVAQGHCRIFSVRRGGRRVATLELRWPNHRIRRPVINQLLGHSNVAVDREVYLAVSDWLAHNEKLVCAPHIAGFGENLDATRWRALWGGYVAEKGPRSIVPERPSGDAVARLCRDVEVLARWLHG
jgi:hypothetical protein